MDLFMLQEFLAVLLVLAALRGTIRFKLICKVRAGMLRRTGSL
jgi:hypothetical protein